MSLQEDLVTVLEACQKALEASEKATPGPWRVDWNLRTNEGVERFGFYEVSAKRGIFWVCKVLGFSAGEGTAQYKANAELIALSRNLIPILARLVLATVYGEPDNGVESLAIAAKAIKEQA